MGRAVRDARLDKREARQKLAARREPYWRMISEGAHLGYYRGARVGKWVARYREAGSGSNYSKRTLGEADDVRDADGAGILSFRQADEAARAWFASLVEERAARSAGPSPTVKEAVDAYITGRDQRESARQGRKLRSSAAHKLSLHVLADAKLAGAKVADLSSEDLVAWRAGLSGSSASRQRITNDFKAALNSKAQSASVRQSIKDGLASPREEVAAGAAEDLASVESKILDDDQTRLLLEVIAKAGDEDFYAVCLVLAATGARFAQVRRLLVRDVQIARERIMMPASHKGRVGGPPRPPIPVPVGPDVVAVLRRLVEGRRGEEPLLERWRHVQISPVVWRRDRRGPWQSAAELTRPMRAAVVASGLPPQTSAYSFRHSSIFRALRDNLPVRLVAQLHDTSIGMIESNYTRFMADHLEGLTREKIKPMIASRSPANVVPIDAARKA